MNLREYIGKTLGLQGPTAKLLLNYFGGSTWADQSVTPASAMQIAAVWRAIKLKASTVGTLPPNIYEDTAQGAKLVRDQVTPYDTLVRVSPNADQTRVEFWESIVGAEALLGNGYALKKRVGKRVVALELLNPQASGPFRNSQNALRYRGYGFHGEHYPDLAPEEVFHLKGFNFGTDEGLSAVSYGAQSLAMTIAANKAAAKIFKSGLSASGFLETGQVLGPDDRDRLNKIMAEYQGNDASDKMMILEGGMKWNRLSMSAVDAQLLSTMGFNIEEIARWFGMPPILLGHSSDGQTMWGTGVEAIIQAWYTLGLRADITRIETAFGKRVIEPADQGRYYLKFNVNGLLRGDSETQARIAASLAQNGLRNRDDLRALDDLPPIPDGSGQKYTVQSNLVYLDKLGADTGQTQQQAFANLVRDIVARELADEAARRPRAAA